MQPISALDTIIFEIVLDSYTSLKLQSSFLLSHMHVVEKSVPELIIFYNLSL